jgi:hypothetical protein
MRRNLPKYAICFLAIAAFLWFSPPDLISQASSGQIEGTVSDENNAAVPTAVITVTNIETGSTRTVSSRETGVFRFPMLPLGKYRLDAEAQNFKRFSREGILLAGGQTATIDIRLQTGPVEESVTVSADSAIADAGKTDLGRVMDTREVGSAPLINRNPLSFGLLQTNVTGGRGRGAFGFTRLSVNGYLFRVKYLLDGNTNTAYNTLGRLANISEVFVSEVQLVTNGFAAEFGDTPGMIMNVITPAGTNELRGSFSYRFRRPPFYSRPFFFPAADLPDNKTNIFTATVGAPIIKDRWQFYFGFESLYRDDKATATRLLTITPENRDLLIAAGLSPSIFPAAIPSLERGKFYIFRSDSQLNDKNRLTARFNLADTSVDNSPQGRLNTLERTVDAFAISPSFAAQLVSYTPTVLNEFRFQFARRRQGARRNELSGTGPSIVIANIANFGSPMNADTIFPPLDVLQFQDNLTRTFGTHVIKFGGGFSRHDYGERRAIFSQYRFPSINAYIAARNGTNPRSYSNYQETFGDPETRLSATYVNLFVQDDWKVTRRLKMTYGLRYDRYLLPKADPTSLLPISQKFTNDKNDLAPRFGIAYALREGKRPTIIRGGAGLYFDAPFLPIYRDVLKFNGNSTFFSFTFTPSTLGAPDFPNAVGSLPPGTPLPQQDAYTIATDYETMYAIHSNIQIEQAINDNLSLAVGYVGSAGRHLNVYRNTNPINPIRQLADGRPVFGDDKLDPRFGWIVIAESAGVSRYDALAVQLRQRLSHWIQFSLNYTLSRGVNDSPDGDREGIFLSDPTNRKTDRGFSSADQRHTFVMSLVAQPRVNIKNKILGRILNNNEFGIIGMANSGERFSILAGFDLNNDGFEDDRPVGFRRNSERTPALSNVDLRYSRSFRLKERFRLEAFAEVQNLFNVKGIIGYSDVLVDTDESTGMMIGPLPDLRARNQSTAHESRQFQLGMKFTF